MEVTASEDRDVAGENPDVRRTRENPNGQRNPHFEKIPTPGNLALLEKSVLPWRCCFYERAVPTTAFLGRLTPAVVDNGRAKMGLTGFCAA
jgi:hypothetical protein